jgi:alanyl-tRNA synthetase
VHPDYLRFDFTHITAMTPEEIKRVQDRVNEKIREMVPVIVHYTTYGEAVEDGALAFFGDTYENEVRTIKIDAPWSFELCGGTHMDSTGGIGTFVITSEAGIGAGIRRIVAVTGIGTEKLIDVRFGALDRIASAVRSTPDHAEERVRVAIEELASARRKVQQLEDQLLRASVSGNAGGRSESFTLTLDGHDVKVDVGSVPASSVDALRKAGDHMRDRIGSGMVLLGSVVDEKPIVIVMVTKDLAGTVVHAGNIARRLASEMGGGGGGRPDVAQAGGKDAAALDSVLSKAKQIIEEVSSAGATK